MGVMNKLIRSAGIGAAIGAVIAGVMILLDQLAPFSVSVNGFIDRAIVRVCPLYLLGFSNEVTSKTEWFVVTIAGNAVLYGVLFVLIAGVAALWQRFWLAQNDQR